MADTRSRNFATIVYPESAKEDWITLLKNYHIAGFISPLHDKDRNKDGSPKKSHYHIMLMFNGKKSLDQVKDIIDNIGGVGIEKIESPKAYARYLVHMDEKDKEHYDVNDVISLGDIEYNIYTKNNKDEIADLKEAILLARSLGAISLSQFIDMIIDNGYNELLPYIIRNAYFFNNYLQRR